MTKILELILNFFKEKDKEFKQENKEVDDISIDDIAASLGLILYTTPIDDTELYKKTIAAFLKRNAVSKLNSYKMNMDIPTSTDIISFVHTYLQKAANAKPEQEHIYDLTTLRSKIKKDFLKKEKPYHKLGQFIIENKKEKNLFFEHADSKKQGNFSNIKKSLHFYCYNKHLECLNIIDNIFQQCFIAPDSENKSHLLKSLNYTISLEDTLLLKEFFSFIKEIKKNKELDIVSQEISKEIESNYSHIESSRNTDKPVKFDMPNFSKLCFAYYALIFSNQSYFNNNLKTAYQEFLQNYIVNTVIKKDNNLTQALFDIWRTLEWCKVSANHEKEIIKQTVWDRKNSLLALWPTEFYKSLTLKNLETFFGSSEKEFYQYSQIENGELAKNSYQEHLTNIINKIQDAQGNDLFIKLGKKYAS